MSKPTIILVHNAAFGEDVVALVYVDAFILDEGEFVFQLLGGSGSAERAGATISEVAASHVSMVSHPEVTLAAILAATAVAEPGAEPT